MSLRAVVLCLLPLAACSGEVQGELAPFAPLVGHWTVEHRVLGADQVYAANYDIRIEGGDTLIHDFRSDYGGGFTGHEELRWDAAQQQFVAQWTDSMSDEVSVTTGDYDEATRTLTMTGKGPDFEHPEQIVDFRHTTVYGDDVADYTMTIIQADGSEQEVMWIHMVRD